jgi:transcriptional regulator with XRE-family HTH domain
MTIPFEEFKARLLANPKVRAEYDALAPEFEISAELIRARRRAGLSQAELAARMGTSQSAIARLESGQTLPSTKTLLGFAKATGSKVHLRLSAASVRERRPRFWGLRLFPFVAFRPRHAVQAPAAVKRVGGQTREPLGQSSRGRMRRMPCGARSEAD